MEHTDHFNPAILREVREILRRSEQRQDAGQIPWRDLDPGKT